MKKSRIVLIAVSLVAALVLYVMGATQFTTFVGGVRVQVYPAAFAGLLGLWMLIRPALKSH